MKKMCKRFSAEVIERLQALVWWDWSAGKIRQYLPCLMYGNLDELPTNRRGDPGENGKRIG
ncbi:hypothetical protein [Butyricimonas synergistica]|nr:hypothetical protein [Butyricimonas synergistica]